MDLTGAPGALCSQRFPKSKMAPTSAAVETAKPLNGNSIETGL
jgi:hypothetical protein